jgi:hypothetical protein
MKINKMALAIGLGLAASGAFAEDLNSVVAVVPNANLPGAFSGWLGRYPRGGRRLHRHLLLRRRRGRLVLVQPDAIAGQRDQQRVAATPAGCAGRAPPRSRSCPAGRCPAAPRRAGTRARWPAPPGPRARSHLEALHLQQRHQRLGRGLPGRPPPGCARRRASAGDAPGVRRAAAALRRSRAPAGRCVTSAQRQADAQPALRAVQRLVGLREQVEHVRQEFRRDAGALVLDARSAARPMRNCASSRMRLPSGVYLAAFTSRFCSTCDSRVESPCTYTGSPAGPPPACGGGPRSRARGLDAARHHVGQRSSSLRSLILPVVSRPTSSRSSTRRVTCVSCRSITSRQLRSTGLGQRLQLHDGDRVADRRQRVAQFVRQHGQELVHAPAGLLQLLEPAPLAHVARDLGEAAQLAGRRP